MFDSNILREADYKVSMRDIYERIEVRFDVDHGSINLM
jgi:hypothetical protein